LERHKLEMLACALRRKAVPREALQRVAQLLGSRRSVRQLTLRPEVVPALKRAHAQLVVTRRKIRRKLSYKGFKKRSMPKRERLLI
jgi:hypothetical protein